VDEGDRRGVDRLTIQEAARRLGISEGAVRKRVTRGTLEHYKDDDGRVYVYLDDGVDKGVDEGVYPNSNALISRLEDEVAFLRDQVRRQQEIIAQQAMTMRQLTAAPQQEPSEAPETLEEEPDRAESHSATGGAQESTERPQQRSGWRAPVDKLPWWQYVLGLIAVAVASGLVSTPWWTDVWFHPGFLRGLEFNELMRTMLGYEFPVWVLPGIFGFWVGLKRQNLSLWRELVPVGVVVATIMLLVAIVVTWLTYGQGAGWWGTLVGIVILEFVPTLIFYVSGATIGRSLQRRTAARYARLTPDTEAAPSAPRSTTPGDSWSPRKQALLGFVGTVIAALISLFASILTTVMAGGG